MKLTVKKLLCCLFALCILSSTLCYAADSRSSAYLDSYCAGLTAVDGGGIVITVDVDAVVRTTALGASRIDLWESTDGEEFYRIAQLYPEDYPLMMGSGWSHYKDVTTYQGVVGRYYQADVYCYAANATGSDTRIYTTAIEKAVHWAFN